MANSVLDLNLMNDVTLSISKACQHLKYYQFTPGGCEIVEGSAIFEVPVSLTVNGEVWLTFMCTPTDLEALAVGFLYNENVIQSPEEIVTLRVCPSGDNVDVWLAHLADKPKQWRRTSGCTGGITGIDVAEKCESKPVVYNGAIYHPEKIGGLVELLSDSQDLYRQSGGVHTSALSDGHGLRVVAEDIGRHNTLDKIAGKCLLNGLDLPQRILLTTGRISSEMLQKAARIGAAIVISRTAPSALAIEMAESWNITLIGYARRDRFRVYTHPERIGG